MFLIPALIWGSTFYVIKFQVGDVPPIWSVSFRFTLSGIILLTFCLTRGVNLKFTLGSHLKMLQLGILLFGVNYWMVYIAEEELTSGLVAVAFSLIMFWNILFGKIFLNKNAEKKTFVGAVLGILGTAIIFYEDLSKLNISEIPVLSLIICFAAVVVASLGNITSASNQQKNIPVIQTNAFGMLYGGIVLAVLGFISGTPLYFLTTQAYIGSLLYLIIFGSIIAFGSYLTLIGRIGADKAGYVLIVIPIIAITLSALFEGLNLSVLIVLGMLLVLVGNYIVLKK